MPNYLSKYFTLEEMIATQVRGVDNTPSVRELANLSRLCNELDKLRKLSGPLHVNSGYRDTEVNRIVGGSITSFHRFGLAADLTPLAREVSLKWLIDTAAQVLDYDQIIYEFGRWVHIGIAEDGVAPRKQLLMIFKPGQYEVYNPSLIK